MSDPVALAAMNNVLQSEAVLAAVGSTRTFTDTFWSNDHSYDIPYANGATLGSPEDRDAHLTAVSDLTASRPPGAPTFVMDSFAALDLAPKGFTIRIADEWFVREGSPARRHLTSSHDIRQIESDNELALFEAASVAGFGGTPPDSPGHTYPAALLSDPRFRFFTLHTDGELAAGVFLFEDPACTGVFTFFTLPGHRNRGIGTALLDEVLGQAPEKLLATNPSSMSREIFASFGFRPAGGRRIWVREAQSGNRSR